MTELSFIVVPWGDKCSPEPNRIVLEEDNWDDFGLKTGYKMSFFDDFEKWVEIGFVKISNSENPKNRLEMNVEKNRIPEGHFSLGSREYYEGLYGLGPEYRESILSFMNDLAYSEELWEKYKGLDVVGNSLLRSHSSAAVEGQLRRAARGGPSLEPYHFEFNFSGNNVAHELVKLDFKVEPGSHPPSNLHVVIGRNGVGKSYFLRALVKTLVLPKHRSVQYGKIRNLLTLHKEVNFSRVLYISYSAFDFEDIVKDGQYLLTELKEVRLLNSKGTPKGEKALFSEFYDYLSVCLDRSRKHLWSEALACLSSDPVFHDLELDSIDLPPEKAEKKAFRKLFKSLSSGHKVVLLAISSLVAFVQEKTLVLMDEPETHLHPPLLASLSRAISKLLIDRNGLAIVATHSPVLLQEVPKTCVWKMEKMANQYSAKRPGDETFGENVGTLTREVFRHEVERSGYYQMLLEVSEDAESYKDALALFDGQLGEEGRALLRLLYL